MLLIVLILDGWLRSSGQHVTEPPPGVGVDHKTVVIAPEWEALFVAGRNLTLLYKNQSYGSGTDLIATASYYLNEITELEKAVDDNRFRSLDAVWEIYLNGGPLHLKQIPYDKFISAYSWNSEAIDEYFSIIDQTRRIWSRLVEELDILMESQIVI